MEILKYEECAGGGHIHLTISDGGKEIVRTFDKTELVVDSELDEVRAALKSAVRNVSPSATAKEHVDWSAVKVALEKK